MLSYGSYVLYINVFLFHLEPVNLLTNEDRKSSSKAEI